MSNPVLDQVPAPAGVTPPARSGATPAAPRPPFAAPTVGAIAAILVMLTGGWLMLAPFALGYQPENADWIDATKHDFFVGLGLLVVGLAALVLAAADLRARLALAGVLPARSTATRREYLSGTPADGEDNGTTEIIGDEELRRLLAPLAAALRRDLDAQAPEPAPAPIEPETPTRARPAPRAFANPAALLVVALTGAWLVIAPFAIGYQPRGADWAQETGNAIVVGLGLLLIGLTAVLAQLVLTVRARLRQLAAEPPSAEVVEAR